jgi:hypothetical protein
VGSEKSEIPEPRFRDGAPAAENNIAAEDLKVNSCKESDEA